MATQKRVRMTFRIEKNISFDVFPRTGEHQDVYDALEHLKQHPTDVLSVEGGEGKRHLMHEYAARHNMKIQTRRRGARIVFRLRPSELTARKPVQKAEIAVKRHTEEVVTLPPLTKSHITWLELSSGRSNS